MINYFILSFLSASILYFSCTNVLIIPIKNKHKLLLYTMLIIVSFLLQANFGQWGTYIILSILLFLIFLFSSNRWINTCCSLLGYIGMVTLNHFSIFVVTNVFKISQIELGTTYGIPFSIYFLFVIIIISYFVGKFIRAKINLRNIHFSKKVSIFIFCDLVICAFIFITNFIFGESIGYPHYIVKINAIFFGIYFFITVAILFLVIRTMQKEYKAQLKINQFEDIQNYTKQLENLYKEMRVFRHDYTNILCSLQCYIDDKDLTGLDKYFKQHILPVSKHLDRYAYEIGKLANIKISELKGLIYTKVNNALSNKIHLYINITCQVTAISMEVTDLIRILGIFWDNAIESSVISANTEIEFNIEELNNSVTITIINSCDDKSISFSNIYQHGYSTKGENRGLGLYSVKQILADYPKVLHTTEFKDHYFIQKLENL